MAIGPWCNGNTPVFGTVIQGSSPCGPTKTPINLFTRFLGFFILGNVANLILCENPIIIYLQVVEYIEK